MAHLDLTNLCLICYFDISVHIVKYDITDICNDTDIYDMDIETRSNMSSHENHQDLSDLNSETSHHDDIDDINEEKVCCVCAVETGDTNELVQCIQCQSLYHCQCHEPPLRCLPRSTTWMCNICRNGLNNETNYISYCTACVKLYLFVCARYRI